MFTDKRMGAHPQVKMGALGGNRFFSRNYCSIIMMQLINSSLQVPSVGLPAIDTCGGRTITSRQLAQLHAAGRQGGGQSLLHLLHLLHVSLQRRDRSLRVLSNRCRGVQRCQELTITFASHAPSRSGPLDHAVTILLAYRGTPLSRHITFSISTVSRHVLVPN